MKTLFVLEAAALGNGKIAQVWGFEELAAVSLIQFLFVSLSLTI